MLPLHCITRCCETILSVESITGYGLQYVQDMVSAERKLRTEAIWKSSDENRTLWTRNVVFG